MARVVHFEITADDPQRASAFYREVFDWEIKSWGDFPYWLATTGPEGAPGINGALMPRRFDQRVIHTIQVDDLDAAIAAIAAAGGELVFGPQPIPGIGTHAYCTDTEGNTLGVLQDEPR